MTRAASCALVLTVLAACSSDDGLKPASAYEARCVSPRTGTDPASGQAYSDTQGTLLDELNWVQSWINDTYLWYSEVKRTDPSKYTDPVAYFAVEKTTAITASNKPKDQFHFTYDTPVWETMSSGGAEAGYGISWDLIASAPPRDLVVALVQPNTPATDAMIVRGAQVLTIDGVDVKNGSDINTLNNGLFPTTGAMHTFEVLDPGATASRSVTLTAGGIVETPVQRVTLPPPYDKVGYLLFNDHIATAEQELITEITALQGAGVTDLVLDLRYNGGGYLDIASELAFMIAGPTVTTGKVFDRVAFNDKHPTTNPVTGGAIDATPFVSQAEGFSAPVNQPLPHLDLPRLFVLTTGGTCSASEAVLNGLAGVGIQVIQIGSTTCGKPYGFYPADNCATTYFAIQFEGVNNKGFGDYADGFVPGGVFKGCVVDDDFTHQLGDPAEGMLAVALSNLNSADNPTCPTQRRSAAVSAATGDGVLSMKPLWRQNAILRH
jgi:C-terminal processing protease CtpA/Prc